MDTFVYVVDIPCATNPQTLTVFSAEVPKFPVGVTLASAPVVTLPNALVPNPTVVTSM